MLGEVRTDTRRDRYGYLTSSQQHGTRLECIKSTSSLSKVVQKAQCLLSAVARAQVLPGFLQGVGQFKAPRTNAFSAVMPHPVEESEQQTKSFLCSTDTDA